MTKELTDDQKIQKYERHLSYFRNKMRGKYTRKTVNCEKCDTRIKKELGVNICEFCSKD